MLLRFHIVLVSCGVLFSFGFAALQFYQGARESSLGQLFLGAFFVLGGAILLLYLRNVLRYGLRGHVKR